MLRDLGLDLDLDVMKRKKPFKVQLALPNQTITQNIKNVKVANISDVKLNSLPHFEFEIPFLVEVKGDGDEIQYIQNPDLLGVKEEKLIKLTWYGGRVNWFKINSIEKTDGENETVNVKIVCDGIESELRKTTITLNELTGIDVYEYFNTVLQQSGWKLGFVADSLKDTFRSFNDDNKVTKYEAVQNGIETYGAIADFDGETRTLNLFNISDLREFKGVVLKKENYADSITINSTSEEIVTRLYATGNENLTIEKANPTGMRYIEDFSYFIYPFKRDENRFVLSHSNYMSDKLCHALLDLKILEDEYNPKIADLQTKLNDAFSELSKKSLEKVELDGQLITIQSLLDTAKATNNKDLIAQRTQELNDKQAEIDAKKEEIDNIQASIDLWNKTIADYQEIISINSFDPETRAELELFVYEKSFNDDRYIDATELYKATVEEFEKYQKPVESFSLNLKTFINSLEAQKYHGRINIGEEVKIKSTKLNEEYTSIILGYNGDIISGDYELEISDSMDDIDAMDKLASIIYQSESSSTILENNKYKWNNITSVKDEVENWRDKEINTVDNRITAGANESITIDNRGIMVRNPDFPNERIIIQSGVVALSKDGGETWSTSITPNGVIAETIIGKIIAGNNLIITNDSGSFVIDNTGLTVDMDSIRIMSGSSGNPENVIESWNKLLLTYDEIASDNLVNEYEKNQLQKQWDTIVGVTSSMISSFDKGWTGKDSEGKPIDKPVEYDEFLTAYEALNKYLNETKQSDGFALLDKTNRKNTTTVDPDVFKKKFLDYETKRQALESIISLEFTKSQILVLEEGISLQYVKNDEIVTQLNLSEEGVKIDGKLLEINSKTEFNADLTMNAGVIRGKDDGIVIDLNTGKITLNTKVEIGAGSNLVTDEEIEEIKGKVTATLSNDMVTLFADVNGSSILYNNATTEMNVYRDGQLETTGWTYSLVKNDAVVATIKDNKVQVTSVRDDVAVLTIQAVKGKEKITKDFTLKKYKSGNGNVNRWMMIADSAHKSVHNEWVPSQIIALGNEQQGLDGDIVPYWGRYKVYESKNGGVDYLLRYTSSDDEKILKYTPVDTDVTHIKVGFYLSGNTLNQIDEQVLPVINDKEKDYTHQAYAYSADGTDRFTKVYPNLNLLPNSTWNMGQGDWNTGFNGRFEILQAESDKPKSHILHGLPMTVGTQQLSHLPHPIFVNKGQEITISFDYKENIKSDIDHIMMNLRIFPDSMTPNSGANSLWNLSLSNKSMGVEEVLEWKRFTYSFICSTDGWLDIIPYDSDTTGNHEGFWRELKVENGTVATPWTPHSDEAKSYNYPAFSGTYTDTYYNGSDDPSKYTWVMFKGEDGEDGEVTHMYQAYAWSDDGKFGFSKTYPQLNINERTDVLPYVANSTYSYADGKPYSITYSRIAVANHGLLLNDYTKMVSGNDYTFSFDVTFATEGVQDFFLFSNQPAGTWGNESIEIDGNVISKAPITDKGNNIPFVFEKDTTYHFVIRLKMLKNIVQSTYKGFIFQPAKTSSTLPYTMTVSSYKLEKGLVETAWMPSKKDARPTDYPTYIGTQLTTERIQSDNPEDYTWALFKGQDSNAFSAWAWTVDGKDGFTTEYPNLNLSPNTKKLIDEDNNIIWGITGSGTTKTEYTEFLVDDNQAVTNGMKITMDGTGTGTQAGWRSPTGANNGSIEVKGSQVTLSAYVKNDSAVEIPIGLQIGMNSNKDNQADNPKYQSKYTLVPANSGVVKLTATFDIPQEYTYIWLYCYNNKNSDVPPTADSPYVWSFAGYKAEWGSKATPWMPAESEYATEWSNYYPKYVGYSETQSENPEDYQWVLNPEWVQASSDNGLSSKADNSDLQSVSDIANDALTRAQNSVLVDDYTSWLEHDYQTTINSMKEVSDQNKADITSIDGRQTIVEGFYDNMKVKWNFIDESFTFGEEGMFISNSQSQMAIQIASDKIVFWDNNVDVAFITGEFLNIKKGVFLESATIGNHLITKFSDGSPVTIIRYIGGDN